MTMESRPFDRERIFLAYPISVRAHGDWLLTEAQIETWVTLFPTLDVRAECRAALAWIDANPTRRKTPRGMKRFLGGWLIRAAADVRMSGRAQATAIRRMERSSVGRADYEFICPHTPHCGGRNLCYVLTALNSARARASR